jgi:hypothetical protein
MNPLARTEKLIVHPMEGETLVYDMERRMALCLNPAAMLIWKRCDGQTSVGQIAQALREELLPDADEAAVWAGLESLNKIHLLAECPPLPGGLTAALRRHSRRKLIVTLASGISSAFALTVLAPTAAHAASFGCTITKNNQSTCSSGCCCTATGAIGSMGTCVANGPACSFGNNHCV